MKIENSENPGMIRIDCMECSRMFEIPDYRNEIFFETAEKCLKKFRLCPQCDEANRKKSEEVARAQAEQQRITDFRLNLRSHLAEAGIPPGYVFDRQSGKPFAEPPMRFVAEWVWRHRKSNFLLSGATGSGKSTGVCFVAAKLLESGTKINYCQLGQLLSLWRAARRSEEAEADLKFLQRLLNRHEVVIIDEVIGKARMSESGRELLFDILEAVNNGECRSRIWLLGNFYSGSIEEIFDEPEPVLRRIKENFVCVRIDPAERKCLKIEIQESRNEGTNR